MVWRKFLVWLTRFFIHLPVWLRLFRTHFCFYCKCWPIIAYYYNYIFNGVFKGVTNQSVFSSFSPFAFADLDLKMTVERAQLPWVTKSAILQISDSPKQASTETGEKEVVVRQSWFLVQRIYLKLDYFY